MSDEPLESEELPEYPSCQNCGRILNGEYCSACGQQNKTVIRILPSLLAEAFAGFFAFNSRTYKTLWYLLSRPAFLSNEYLAGRRASYLPPLRLFLVSVVIFIFAISLELFLNSIASISNPAQSTDPAIEDTIAANLSSPPVDTPIRDDQSILINDQQYDSLQDYLGQLKLPFLSVELNRLVINLLQDSADNNLAGILEDPGSFFIAVLDYVPIMMLLMVPILALIQQIVFIGSRRYYIEHLVLTIHNHSFLFIAFIAFFLLDSLEGLNWTVLNYLTGSLATLTRIWLVAYLFLSLKTFFKQGYLLTTLKFLAASITYSICLFIALFVLVVFGFLTY